MDRTEEYDLHQYFSAPAVPAPPTLMDVARDIDCATNMLVQALERDDTIAVNFYKSIWQQYIAEQARFTLDSTQQND